MARFTGYHCLNGHDFGDKQRKGALPYAQLICPKCGAYGFPETDAEAATRRTTTADVSRNTANRFHTRDNS